MKFSIEDDNNGSIGALGNNLTGLKKTLQSNFERMEALLLEARSTASREAQQYEELRQMEEAKDGMMEVQLLEKEENLRSKESAIRHLEESLTAKIQELEHQLTEKENLTGLLVQRTAEIGNLRSETEARAVMLEAQLQEKEENLRMKESANSKLEESLTAKIQEMEHQLTEKEDLLDKGGQEIMNFSGGGYSPQAAGSAAEE
ncbi:MAG: hypothetical protein IH856_24590 [Deltaproteobacteria bacterium]|nr:hypothetical protein [Deltaproteobacteria bacterium]